MIYSDLYEVDLGEHVFPTVKYRMVKDRLIFEKNISGEIFRSPNLIDDDDLLSVHTNEYLNKVKALSLSVQEIFRLEVPLTKEIRDASLACCSGTIMAIQEAAREGIGIHIGGGFHHAFPDHGEGFCVFNDVAVGIRKIQGEGLFRKFLVIDCDLHQGNGTAFIFNGDREVFTFSIHQENNYPLVKPPSDLDVGLEDGADDKAYMSGLKRYIPEIITSFRPDCIIYLAGADPYLDDQLGGLGLTIDGLSERDRHIIGIARDQNIPVVILLAGGYANNLEDTVQIHLNTIDIGIIFYHNKRIV